MTATMNLGGEAIRIDRKYMPLLLQLHSKGAAGVDPATTTALEILEAGRLVIEGELHPMASAMMEIIADPPLVLSVERMRNGSVAASTIWATPHGAVVGSRVENQIYEIKLANADLIPFHLFQLTHLRPLPDRKPLAATLSPEALLEAEQHVDRRHDAAAIATLEAAGVKDAAALVEKLRHRVASWTIHSVWRGSGTVQTGSACGIDCAAQGYVLVEADVERANITLRSASFKEVLTAIRGTMPG